MVSYLLIHSTVQSPSWAANWFAASQEIPPPFHGTRKFITALTSVRHLSLSWASPIQSIYPHPTSWGSILILSTHLGLGLLSGLLPSGFPTKTLYTPSPHPYAPHAQPISFFSILSPAQYWVSSTKHLAPSYAISSIPPLPRPSSVQVFPQLHILKHPQLPFLPQCQRSNFTPIQIESVTKFKLLLKKCRLIERLFSFSSVQPVLSCRLICKGLLLERSQHCIIKWCMCFGWSQPAWIPRCVSNERFRNNSRYN